jgi:hypothetical protein
MKSSKSLGEFIRMSLMDVLSIADFKCRPNIAPCAALILPLGFAPQPLLDVLSSLRITRAVREWGEGAGRICRQIGAE